jgi:hypothetical protein
MHQSLLAGSDQSRYGSVTKAPAATAATLSIEKKARGPTRSPICISSLEKCAPARVSPSVRPRPQLNKLPGRCGGAAGGTGICACPRGGWRRSAAPAPDDIASAEAWGAAKANRRSRTNCDFGAAVRGDGVRYKRRFLQMCSHHLIKTVARRPLARRRGRSRTGSAIARSAVPSQAG